jgi:hypothetical protein
MNYQKLTFENIMQLLKPKYEKSIITQIRTLTALRDSLLPKLMSGEVKVATEKDD